MDADALARDLLPRLRRWTQNNWSQPAVPPAGGPVAPADGTGEPPARAEGGGEPAQVRGTGGRPRVRGSGKPAARERGKGERVVSRGEVAAGTVQRLADLAADAEGEPRRQVPRLADVTIADQLTVMVEDILRTADPAAARAAAAELAALRTALGYR
jgi:hypothetical protein